MKQKNVSDVLRSCDVCANAKVGYVTQTNFNAFIYQRMYLYICILHTAATKDIRKLSMGKEDDTDTSDKGGGICDCP